MLVITGSIALSWALAAPPSASTDGEAERLRKLQVQGLHVRSETLREALAERCSEPGLLATVSSEDAAQAVRAAALFEETAALINELLATEPRASERDMLNLSLARAYADAAQMLLKAHACGPDRVYLDRAGRLLRRAVATAGSEPENVEFVDVVQRQLDKRRAEFPPRRPRPPPPPEPCPVCAPPAAPRVEPPPWPERLVLRFQGGVAFGRRLREESMKSGPGFTQVGATLGLSLLGRAVLTPRWALLFGPSYTYWRGKKFGGGSDVHTTSSHQVTARVETAVGLGRRWREAISVHPGLEVGIEYIYLEIPRGESDAPQTPRGPLFAGSVGVCLAGASVCASGRVGRAVGTADDYPTVAVVLGVDIFGAVRAYRFRRGRR